MRLSPIDELRRGAVTSGETAASRRRSPTDPLVGDALDRFRDDDRAPALVSDADEGTVGG